MAEDYNGAGFTVKEMLVRLETKVDVILADHEARIRKIEATDAEAAGESTRSGKLSASLLSWAAIALALLGNASTIIWLTH